jgi:hypothetical protein
MLWLFSKLAWVLRVHPGMPLYGPTWAFFSPGVRRDYEPLYTDARKDWRPLP